ncbi:MAG: VWA domain-containing protein [Candidatus Sulfopaludibacter sp.]|nr:VWA domain-containing protein [Candidatus Sulfopaludibacter sp.]
MRSCLLLLAAAFAAASEQPQGEAQRPLLAFNLVAYDAKGEPLRDLQAGDLRIYDDGKLMHAVFCRPLETAQPEIAPLGAREYSNRPTGAKLHSTLVLLDLLNANLAERGMGWNEIARTLGKLESGEQLYLYLLTKEGVVFPIHAMPAADSPVLPDDNAWIGQAQGLLDKAMHDVNRLRPWEFQADADARVQKTLAVLREVGSDFSAQPGRKSLVWISHGVPILARGADGNLHDSEPAVMHLATDLARSGIAIYAVDQAERSTTGLNSTDTLQQLAGLTGGQWLPSDSTEKAIRQAIGEGPATYQVGYSPDLDRWNGKFHKLRVTTGAKGTRIRAIEGYFGDPREKDPAERLALASLGGADDPGVGIRAAAAPSEKVKGWIHFRIRVNAADLQLGSGEPYSGGFGLMFAYYTTEWQPEASQEIPTELHLNAAEHARILRDGVVLTLDRPLPAGVRKVRIVVRDKQSGAVGSLSVPVA